MADAPPSGIIAIVTDRSHHSLCAPVALLHTYNATGADTLTLIHGLMHRSLIDRTT